MTTSTVNNDPPDGPSATGQDPSVSGLKYKSARSVLWVGSGQVFQRLLSLVITAILARLLAPSLFGLLEMATVVMNLIALTAELGLAQALIQRGNLREEHLSSAFWANLGLGIVLLIVSVIVAPYAAAFYREPLVRPILMALSMNFLILSFGSIHSALLQKRMDFKAIAIIDSVGTLLYGIIVVMLALTGWGVWALVVGGLARNVIKSISLWLAYSWRPKVLFEWKAFRELFSFGINLMATRILDYLGNSLGKMLVGRFLGASPLGFYSVAFNLSFVTTSRVSSPLTQIMFPAFSLVQDDKRKLHSGYLQVTAYTALLTFPFAIAMIILAPEVVQVVYGSQWLPSVVIVQILGIGSILNALPPLNGPVLKARGRPDVAFKFSLFRNFVYIFMTLVGLQFGLLGLAWSDSMSKLIFFVASVAVTCSVIGLAIKSYFRNLRLILLCAGVMGLVLLLWKACVTYLGFAPLAILVSCVIVGGASYLLALWVMGEPALPEMVQIALKSIYPYLRLVFDFCRIRMPRFSR